MQKISTMRTSGKNYFPRTDDYWVGSGRSLQCVLRFE